MAFPFSLALLQQPANPLEINVRDFYSRPGLPVEEDAEAIQKAIDKAIDQGGGTVRIPVIGRKYVLTRSIVIAPSRKGYWHQVQLRVVGDGNIGDIRYLGAPGTAAFRCLAPKLLELDGISVDLERSGTIGFELSHRTWEGKNKSINDTRITRCRVRMAPSTQNCVGFAVGTEATPQEFGDTNGVILDHCKVMYENDGGMDRKSADYMKFVADQGHVGYSINGGNTLANALQFCAVTGMRVGFTMKNDAELKGSWNTAGGSNNLLECQGNYTAVMISLPGGVGMAVRGGRFEHIGAALHIGPRKAEGREDGYVAFYDTVIDAVHAERNADCGFLVEPALFGLHFAGSLLLQNVNLSNTGPDQLFSFRSFSSNLGRHLVTIISSRQKYGGSWSDPASWDRWVKVREPWRVVVDGREVWRNRSSGAVSSLDADPFRP